MTQANLTPDDDELQMVRDLAGRMLSNPDGPGMTHLRYACGWALERWADDGAKIRDTLNVMADLFTGCAPEQQPDMWHVAAARDALDQAIAHMRRQQDILLGMSSRDASSD